MDQRTVGAEEYSALHRIVFLPVGGGGRGQLSVCYVPLVRERNWFQSPSTKRKCSEKRIWVVERRWRSQGVIVRDGWQRCRPLCILALRRPQSCEHAPPLAFFRKSVDVMQERQRLMREIESKIKPEGDNAAVPVFTLPAPDQLVTQHNTQGFTLTVMRVWYCSRAKPKQIRLWSYFSKLKQHCLQYKQHLHSCTVHFRPQYIQQQHLQ